MKTANTHSGNSISEKVRNKRIRGIFLPFLRNNILAAKIAPISIAVIIYLLSMIFTSPTRHGADRFYLLALNIIKHQSVNIQKLTEDRNHYAIVSVDVFQQGDVRYIGVHPGQAFFGLPGLGTYYFFKQFNNFSREVDVDQDANDKYDFFFGTFAMNSTSNALFTAVTALFFVYIINSAFLLSQRKRLGAAIFVFFFYLATPLFYYSTHIIENQAESCMIFVVLGLLSWIVITENEKTKGFYYLLTGFVIGLAFLTNFSSVILLLFGIVHIQLNGFLNLNSSNLKRVVPNIRVEVNNDFRKKTLRIAWLCLGCFLPVALLGYYQYLLFTNPFKSVYSFLAELPHTSSQSLIDYVTAFISSFIQYMFSPNVGLFSFTPILFFPILVFILGIKHKKSQSGELETNKSPQLHRSLVITMLMIQPLYIIFYTTFAAMHFVRNGELISNYNLYSARHLLPIVLPLGYLLFDSIINLDKFNFITKRVLWGLLILLWIFSLITNISATLIGDWIFGLDQIWRYIQTLVDNGLWGLLKQGRWLIDW